MRARPFARFAMRHLDEVEIPTGCLDVAAQQIVAIAAEEDEIGEGRPAPHPARQRAISHLSSADELSASCSTQMADALCPIAFRAPSPKIFYDSRRGHGPPSPWRSSRPRSLPAAPFPEAGNYDVVIASEGRKIGDVEEDFAQESMRGDIFSLGSMPWRILGISKNRLLVEPAPGMAPSLPFWQTEAGGRSPALSSEVSELRDEIAKRLQDAHNDRRSTPITAARDAVPTAPERDIADWLSAQCRLERCRRIAG